MGWTVLASFVKSHVFTVTDGSDFTAVGCKFLGSLQLPCVFTSPRTVSENYGDWPTRCVYSEIAFKVIHQKRAGLRERRVPFNSQSLSLFFPPAR